MGPCSSTYDQRKENQDTNAWFSPTRESSSELGQKSYYEQES